ncbi:MAG: hypothetical protein ACRCY4_09475 [Brevinema sp.]
MAALKRVFLQFTKKPDGSYQPSISKQKTTIGAFLVSSGYFDNIGINANGEDIDGIRTVLADFFTKSPYTVQATPLFFFEGTNNLVVNTVNAIGSSMNIKAGFGSLCTLMSVAFGSTKVLSTIGVLLINGSTTYCNLVNVYNMGIYLLDSILSNNSRMLSYSPPSSIDIAAEQTKDCVLTSMNITIAYTKQGIVKIITISGRYTFFINTQTKQNNSEITTIFRQLTRDDLNVLDSANPVLTNSFALSTPCEYPLPNFTPDSKYAKTYDVLYADKNVLSSPRMFANFGYDVLDPTSSQILDQNDKKIGTFAISPILMSKTSLKGKYGRYFTFPKAKEFQNAYCEFSSLCNIYTSHYAYFSSAKGTALIPYKIKARCGYFIKFPNEINGWCDVGDPATFYVSALSPYVCGGVIYLTDPNNQGSYFYDFYDVHIGMRTVSSDPVDLKFIVTYVDLSKETKTITLPRGNIYGDIVESFFKLIGFGTRFVSTLKPTINCVELTEANAYGFRMKYIPEFSTEGVHLNENPTNKKILKFSYYFIIPDPARTITLFKGLFLILSPKT